MANEFLIRWKTFTILSISLIAATEVKAASGTSGNSASLQCLKCNKQCENLIQRNCDPGDLCQVTIINGTLITADCASLDYCEFQAPGVVVYCCSTNNCTSSFLKDPSSVLKSPSETESQESNTSTLPSTATKLSVSILGFTLFTGTLVLLLA